MSIIYIERLGKAPGKAEVLVDPDIYDLVTRKGWNLQLTHKGYVVIRMTLHHFVKGKPSAGNVIDHVNGNRADNRRENLREVTAAQNSQSCRQTRKANQTGLRGVVTGVNGRFYARGRVNGELVHCGAFDSPRAAHAAYLRAMTERGSLLPSDGHDLDYTTLTEFPDSVSLRRKADPSLPPGVTKVGKNYRASIRREHQTFHQGTHKTPEKAAEAVTRAARVYENGGVDALRALK